MCGFKMPPNNTNLNILDLCRLCLERDNSLIPVFDNAISNQLSYKINVCLAVEIKNEDEVSQKICNDCLTKVNSFFEFRSATLECQNVLKRWASKGMQKEVDANRGALEKSTAELNKTNESDKSDSDSRYDEENVTQELIRFYKSLASNVPIPASDIVSSESEVPGPSGLQEGNKKSSYEEGRVKGTDHIREMTSVTVDPKKKNISETAEYKNKKISDFVEFKRKKVSRKYSTRKKISGTVDRKRKKVPGYVGIKREIMTDFKCGECESDFKTSSLLRNHIKEAHGSYACDCGAKFTSAKYLARHESRHNAKPTIPCKLCSKLFLTTSEMKDHQKSHQVGQQLSCHLCSYVTFFKSNLVRHVKRHNKDYTVYCDTCEEGFFSKDELRTHQIRKHGADPYFCHMCRKTFTSKCYLLEHNKTIHYIKTRDFLCETCGKDFKTKAASKRHMKLHLGLKYECRTCKKSVNSAYSLKKHMKTHQGEKNVVCHVCGKAFVDTKYMAAHLRIHTGERPFVCLDCGKRFSQATTLKVHKRSHTGERPYSCQQCGVSFITNSLLTSHIKTHFSHFLIESKSCEKPLEQLSESGPPADNEPIISNGILELANAALQSEKLSIGHVS